MSDQPTPATTNSPGVSQAAIFAKKYAENAAQEMLDAIKMIGRRNTRITAIALGVSMPHQISFLFAAVMPFLTWSGPDHWAESIGLIAFAVFTPVATDFYILNQISTIAARAAARGSKIYAIVTLLIPTTVSGTVNFLAPGPGLIKYLAIWIVTLIPLAEAGRAFLRPDFAKIEQMELGAEAQLTRTAETLTVRTEDVEEPNAALVSARELNRQRMAAAERARDLAMAAHGNITIAALTRATNCGRGSAKRAIELAKEAFPVSEVVVVE